MSCRSSRNRIDTPGVTRRQVTQSLAWAGVGLVGLSSGLIPTAQASSPRLPAAKKVLEESSFAYISPLTSKGQESSCHAELWFAWLDDAVVVTVAADRWKATALAKGLDRARVWVGDHGRWKTWYGGTNEDFRKAASFEAKVSRVQNETIFPRLMATYEKKYPEEIADWREAMHKGNADGTRVLLQYRSI